MKTLRDYLKDDTFTSRSRKVFELAHQEAMRLNHDCVGSQHLLLGLAKEGSGVGANALKYFDITLHTLRASLQEIHPAGPDMVHITGLPLDTFIQKALDQSRIEAQQLNHSYIGTEHLLLGLLRVSERSTAHAILEKQGVTNQAVIDEVLRMLGHKPSPESMVVQRIEDGTLVFSADQVKELLGREFPDSGTCPGYQAGFLFGQCEYHLIGNQLVPHLGGLPADGPNFQLTMVPRPA